MNMLPSRLQPVDARMLAVARRFPLWAERTLDGMLDAAAKEFADRPYVIGEQRGFTYAEMAAWSRRLAAGLMRAGVQPGDHVALVMANYPEFVALKFAISRVGAVAVPINMLNRRDELGYLLQQSDSVMLITMSAFRDLDYLGMLDELAPGWEEGGGGEQFPRLRAVLVFETGEALARLGARSLAELDDGTELTGSRLPVPGSNADIIYTSGTTGSPKGVMLTHDMLLRTAFTSAYGRAFEDGRRIVFALPMYHVFGYVEGLLSVLFVGGAVIPMLKFDAPAMLASAERNLATDILAVPTMTLALIDAQRSSPRDLTSVQAILSSGTRAPERVWGEIRSVLNIGEITTGYGMTEVTASSTVTRPNDPPERLLTTNGRLRDAGPAGDPALGGRLVVYRVVDPVTGTTLAAGEVGELRARGPGVTPGYYNKPEETAAAFDQEGWLRTGDLGWIDADDYLVLAGRLKESYRCGGEQVLPTEVEDLLTRHPEVVQAHVVPVPDDRMGEAGAAFIVLAAGSQLSGDELRRLCSDNLARFKVPKHVLLVDEGEIPTTASGRARKFMLSEIATERLQLR
jgi:fatty-acyl-CoA synthase